LNLEKISNKAYDPPGAGQSHARSTADKENQNMARPEETDLYQKLITSEFSFLSRGTRTINEIYNAVKAQYPACCDDLYYCSENCCSGNNQPEWNHTVRNALQYLKSKSYTITYTGRRGFWKFQ